MRPPGDRAERRADISEQDLQHGPEADQQRGGHAHEFEKETERQYQAQISPGIQHQIGADHAGHRTTGADDRRIGRRQGPRPGQIGQRTGENEKDKETTGTERALGGYTEDDQEQQVGGEVDPVGMNEQGGDEAVEPQLGKLGLPGHAGVQQRGRHGAPYAQQPTAAAGRFGDDPEEHGHAGRDQQQGGPGRLSTASTLQLNEHRRGLRSASAARIQEARTLVFQDNPVAADLDQLEALELVAFGAALAIDDDETLVGLGGKDVHAELELGQAAAGRQRQLPHQLEI